MLDIWGQGCQRPYAFGLEEWKSGGYSNAYLDAAPAPQLHFYSSAQLPEDEQADIQLLQNSEHEISRLHETMACRLNLVSDVPVHLFGMFLARTTRETVAICVITSRRCLQLVIQTEPITVLWEYDMLNEIILEGGGGAKGSCCNGTYLRDEALHSGKPCWSPVDGEARIYFNFYWKLNYAASYKGWVYADKEATGPLPPNKWKTDGYTQAARDAMPIPLVANAQTNKSSIRTGEHRCINLVNPVPRVAR